MSRLCSLCVLFLTVNIDSFKTSRRTSGGQRTVCKPAPSFHHVGSRHQTHRHGGSKYLYPLSHVAGARFSFSSSLDINDNTGSIRLLRAALGIGKYRCELIFNLCLPVSVSGLFRALGRFFLLCTNLTTLPSSAALTATLESRDLHHCHSW